MPFYMAALALLSDFMAGDRNPTSANETLEASQLEAAELSGMLRQAAQGKGDFGVGTLTEDQANAAGMAWVGPKATLSSSGKAWVSEDRLRQYRPASFKPNLGKVQANLEWRVKPRGEWQGDAHIDIKPSN